MIEILQRALRRGDLDKLVLGMLGGALLVVGFATLLRSIFFKDVIAERYAMHLYRRHIIAAVITGVVTGFVIGLTSAGSGTLIAIALIAIFRLTPQRVVGTDIFHAAVLLWAAGIAHWIGGNIDFVLAGNILLGSVPGVLLGGSSRSRRRRRSCAGARRRPDRLRHHAGGQGGSARGRRPRDRGRPRSWSAGCSPSRRSPSAA